MRPQYEWVALHLRTEWIDSRVELRFMNRRDTPQEPIYTYVMGNEYIHLAIVQSDIMWHLINM